LYPRLRAAAWDLSQLEEQYQIRGRSTTGAVIDIHPAPLSVRAISTWAASVWPRSNYWHLYNQSTITSQSLP